MSRRTVLLVIGIGAAALLALCGLGVAGLAWLKPTLGAEPVWTVVHAAPPQFQVKATERDFHFRELGFQDPHYELLFEVHDVAKFLGENGLEQGAEAPPAIDDAPVKATRALELDGFTQDQLVHGGQLWEVGAKRFVYLVVFGT